MATGTRLMQEISDQFLNCKICFENFREPKTLSCLHTFCCGCLQQQYDQECVSRTSRYSIYNRQVTCPLCRKKTDLPTGGVRRLPDNFLVSNLTEVVAKRTVSKVPPCEICFSVRGKSVDACSKCLDCTKLLCKGCVDLHLATKVTQQHSLIDLEGEKDIQCKIHLDEHVRFYCGPCDACICVVCAFQEHKDHDVCSFSDGSAKYKSALEALLTKCKDRLGQVNTRLNIIDKFEFTIKDVKDTIRDLAISYIAQVRTKEKELMKHIDDLYGGEIKTFVEQKSVLQENLDELQSTCNLTDIMLKDKGVELLLIKKEIETKMTQLLEPELPVIPSDPRYDVKFVPGDVALGRLSYGLGLDLEEVEKEKCLMMKGKMGVDGVVMNGVVNDYRHVPDVITNCTQTEKCRTKEEATSMLSDMKNAFRSSVSQTEKQGLITRDTCTIQVETRERGVSALVNDVKAKGTMTERSDVRSLKCQTDRSSYDIAEAIERSVGSNKGSLTTAGDKSISSQYNGNSFSGDQESCKNASPVYYSNGRPECTPVPDLLYSSEGMTSLSCTPARRIRSIKIQTNISALDIAGEASEKQFIQEVLLAEPKDERLKLDATVTSNLTRARERRRRLEGIESALGDRQLEKNSQACPICMGKPQASSVSPAVSRRPSVDCSTATEKKTQNEKSTWTNFVSFTDKDTNTPQVTQETKVTWTERMATSDRATCTVGVKCQDRATGTVAAKAVDFGSQVSPPANVVATNTPVIYSSEHECQTAVETTEQGTVPDPDIERASGKSRPLSVALDSSVDFMTPPQSPVKSLVTMCDKASDPIRTPCLSRATETIKVKLVTSATETVLAKTLDKETATLVPKTIEQWTETVSPTMISTGVTPPVPATIDVGVATNVMLTNEQATCTEVKAYRESHTETVLVVCDNETLTDTKTFSDAQTAVEILTENQECETNKLDNADECSMTDTCTTWEAPRLDKDSQSPQSEAPSQRSSVTNSRRLRRRAREVQTAPVRCSFCSRATPSGDEFVVEGAPNSVDVVNKSNKVLAYTQDVGTMAISCITCYHDFHEAGIQTSQPQLYDKASAATFEIDQDFLERALSRQFQDAATSTDSLPHFGLLSECDVDDLIVVPEATFELVLDQCDLIMVDDETSTDFLQYAETGTQTLVANDDLISAKECLVTSMTSSMADSTGSKGIGEVIRSLVLKEGLIPEARPDAGANTRQLVSTGVNTVPKVTSEKETCTSIRNLLTKGTMTLSVTSMDKSTSTFNQARIVTGTPLSSRTKCEDKVTMTSKADFKHVGTETDSTTMDGKITACISKLRNVSERLNSPPARKASDSFFGSGFASPKTGSKLPHEIPLSPDLRSGRNFEDKPEDVRQKQVKDLLEQTNAVLKPKEQVSGRKPQPITTLKCRKPASLSSALDAGSSSPKLLRPEEAKYDSKSLPRGFPSDRPGTVRMGSQPLIPSRLPLLRYNSAPGRIATVPAQTLLQKSNQSNAEASRRMSPSKIPITKKMSPPEYVSKQQHSVDTKSQDPISPKPQLRRPLPSITETRTPSSCSDTSTASHVSVGSFTGPSSAALNRISIESSGPASRISTESSVFTDHSIISSNRLSNDSTLTISSISPNTSSMNADSASDTVFAKSSTSTAGSTENLDEKSVSTEEKATKKSSMGFMQRLLSKKKKPPEEKKKEPVNVIKSGPTTASAVAALATATPPLPTPAPESHALSNPQFPPHHYPPPPEHKTPPPPRKPRPFVYVRQRIFSIQQDNVEDAEEKRSREKSEEINVQEAKPQTKDLKDSPKVSEKEKALEKTKEKAPEKVKEKASEKTKEKSKKEEKNKVEKDKKKEAEKEKAKVKTTKAKVKKTSDKSGGTTGAKKEGETGS
ncbi:mucin-5AC [Biomphalaria glabrata]|nr:mucin-5AC [Biomphalaria glabrata]